MGSTTMNISGAKIVLIVSKPIGTHHPNKYIRLKWLSLCVSVMVTFLATGHLPLVNVMESI